MSSRSLLPPPPWGLHQHRDFLCSSLQGVSILFLCPLSCSSPTPNLLSLFLTLPLKTALCNYLQLLESWPPPFSGLLTVPHCFLCVSEILSLSCFPLRVCCWVGGGRHEGTLDPKTAGGWKVISNDRNSEWQPVLFCFVLHLSNL